MILTSETPHFSAIYHDPDAGDIANKYQIQVDDNNDFSSPFWDTGSGGTAITNLVEGSRSIDIVYAGSALSHNTEYFYRLKFWDDDNSEGVWSTENVSFKINLTPLAADGLLTEANVNPINLTDTTPEFSAVFHDDTGAKALKYQIQVNSESTFSGAVLWDSGSNGTALSGTGCTVETRCGQISYAGSPLSGGVTYYWRIKFWDNDGQQSPWSTETASFSLETNEPKSRILYPKNGDDLKRLPKIMGTAWDDQNAIAYVKISIKNNTTGKWYTGSNFVSDTEVWLMANGQEDWSYRSPNWEAGTSYTIRSRATDIALNEEKTAEATFTFDTSNGEAGSIYAESIRVAENTNYTVYFPVTIALNTGDKVEVVFNSGAYAFT